MSNEPKAIRGPTHFNLGELAVMLEVDLSDAKHIVSTVEPSSIVNGVTRWFLRDVAVRYSMFRDGYIPNPAKFTAQQRMDWNSGNVLKKEIEEIDARIAERKRKNHKRYLVRFFTSILRKCSDQ